ncbi:Ig-like domain-containing protein [Mycobacterium sp. C3-094]
MGAHSAIRKNRRHRQPYAWLGAGAVAFGVGAAALAGAGIASADDTSSSSSESDNARVGSPGASTETHRDRHVTRTRTTEQTRSDTENRGTVRLRNVERTERVARRATPPDDTDGPVDTPVVSAVFAAIRRSPADKATNTVAPQALSAAPPNTPPTFTTSVHGPDPATGAVRVIMVADDPDGEPAGFFGSSSTPSGTIEWVPEMIVSGSTSSASFIYTPNAAARHAAAAPGGPTSTAIAIEVQDGYGGRTQGSVVVPILALNTAPVITNSTPRPANSRGAISGTVEVHDPDNDSVVYSATLAAKGTVKINAKTGAYTYTPLATARHGASSTAASVADRTDTFTVTVDDRHGGLTSQIITVALSPTNRAPKIRVSVKKPDKLTGIVTGSATGSDPDKDALTFSVTGATKGSVTIDTSTGTFTYIPTITARRAAGAPGASKATKTDTLTVVVSDGHGGVATKTVTVTIAALNGNTPPVVGPVTVGQPDAISGVLSGAVGASDGDGDPLDFTLGSGPGRGVVTVGADGSFTYTPTASQRPTTGGLTDTFTVVVSDGTLSTVATVSVPVAPIPDHLDAGQWLQPNQYILSHNGRYKLVMQGDGNLVEYDNQTNAALWASGTNGRAGLRAAMQGDGNFVLYTPAPQTGVWSTKTNGYPGSRIVLQDDGNLVVYQGSTALWDRHAGRLNPGGGGGGNAGSGGVHGDDYPASLKNAGLDTKVDPWGFYNRECTSFVAWRLNSVNGVAFTNTMRGGRWGNATNWAANARALGYTVNNTPAVGSVGWLSSGHVAWVAAVNGDSVVIEEYNYGYTGVYKTRTVSRSYFNGYIHIKDL